MLSLSDNNITALIISAPGIIASVLSAVGLVMNKFNHQENVASINRNARKLDRVEDVVNGKMSELLEITKTSAFAEGEKHEKDKGDFK